MKVLFTDLPWGEAELERPILDSIPAQIVIAPEGEEATLVRLAADVDAIATCWAKVTTRVIETAPRLKIVARMGIGLDNIDLKTAAARGVPVTNVPDYCIEEVADHALALLLAMSRNVAFFHFRTKSGEYNLKAGPPMRRLTGQTLGLLGLGRIGRRVAEKARGLGLKVIAHTASGQDHGTGCEMVSLDELLRRSDFLSLHAPLTPGTRHILNDEAFAKMKPTAAVINTSRGPLVDPESLWRALQSNRIAGAGLDVFEPEPPDLSLPLYRDERVIVTPHAAFVSQEALADLRRRVAEQIRARLTGGTPENVVNGVPV